MRRALISAFGLVCAGCTSYLNRVPLADVVRSPRDFMERTVRVCGELGADADVLYVRGAAPIGHHGPPGIYLRMNGCPARPSGAVQCITGSVERKDGLSREQADALDTVIITSGSLPPEHIFRARC